ncbi:MAG: phosphotransferase [Actinomycetota bacterium]
MGGVGEAWIFGDPALGSVLAAMPSLGARDAVTVAPVDGGITNRNFLVAGGGHRYFLRMAGAKTEVLGIDRGVEAAAARAAADSGIAPQVVAADPDNGCLVTEFVDGFPIAPERMREPEVLGRVVTSVKAFHSAHSIPGTFSPFAVVEAYRRAARERGVEEPDAYAWLSERAHSIKRSFDAFPVTSRPCHNDLLNANFIECDGRVLIVDYEYAGMGDLYFDLGNMSVNNDLDDHANEALLEFYFGDVTAARRARLHLMRIMSDFREAMWGHLQRALSTLDFDYKGYADEHFERCRRQASDPSYERWLSDAAGGN